MPAPLTVVELPAASFTVVPAGVILVDGPFSSPTVTLLRPFTSLARLYVKVVPSCLTSRLSPAWNLTVSPPCTFSTVPPAAVTFHADRSLTCCLPAGVKLLKSWFAALSILAFVASSILTVTSSPLATVVKPFSPLMLNFTSPVLKDFSSVEPVLPPKEILRPIASVFLSI